MSPLRNLQDLRGPRKISGSPDMNFGLGDLTPKGGRSPQLVGALGRDPTGARSAERNAAICSRCEENRIRNFFSVT